MRKRRGGRTVGPAAVIAVLLLAVGLYGALRLDSRLREVVTQIAVTNAKGYCVSAVNDCVTQSLAECDDDFGRLIKLGTGESGVNLLVSDTSAINTLKAKLTSQIQERLTAYEAGSVKVALGTILGSDLFSDRGPRFAVKIIPLGYVTTSLRNEFTEAGINQTVYRIMLTVNARVTAVMSGYSKTEDVETEFCISETVIVGAVPGAYTEVKEAQDKISSIYDFMSNEDGSHGVS